MSFRFRKSFKLAPGVKINLNKKSSSITFGKKSVHKTFSSTRRTTNSVGIPGTGIHYTQTSSNKSPKISKQVVTVVPSRIKSNISAVLCVIFLLFAIFSFNSTGIISTMLGAACSVISICMFASHRLYRIRKEDEAVVSEANAFFSEDSKELEEQRKKQDKERQYKE